MATILPYTGKVLMTETFAVTHHSQINFCGKANIGALQLNEFSYLIIPLNYGTE